MSENTKKGLLAKLSYIALALLFLYLLFRYLLPWTLPLVLSFITATIIEPLVRRLTENFGIKRGFASFFCSLIVLTITISAFTFLIMRVIYELSSLSSHLPEIWSSGEKLLENLSIKAENFIASFPEGIRDFLTGALNSVKTKTESISVTLTEFILGILSSAASMAPKIVLFIMTYIIGMFFVSASYTEIRDFLLRQVPPRHHKKLLKIKSDVRSTLCKWIKAEALLISITFFELLFGFALLKIPYSLTLAVITALIDALPVFGVGTILLPWAAGKLFLGDTKCAVSLIILYGFITVIRSIIEPKIVGKQLGLNPAVTLLVMYIGFSSLGIVGMLTFPLLTIFLKQLNDKGYIKLWKT